MTQTTSPLRRDAHRGHRQDLLESALEAEQQTGVHEPTKMAARPHLFVRVGRIGGGCIVLLAGVALMVLPGPGVALVIGGLSILAVDVPFAARLRGALMERTNRVTGLVPGHLKRWFLIAGTAIGVAVACIVALR